MARTRIIKVYRRTIWTSGIRCITSWHETQADGLNYDPADVQRGAVVTVTEFCVPVRKAQLVDWLNNWAIVTAAN
jgi:hypothetical protein